MAGSESRVYIDADFETIQVEREKFKGRIVWINSLMTEAQQDWAFENGIYGLMPVGAITETHVEIMKYYLGVK